MNGREQPLTPHVPAGASQLAAALAVVLVAVLLVGGAWQYTRQRIADNESQRLLAEISAVLPPTLYNNQPQLDSVLLDTGSGRTLPVYRARLNGVATAAVLTVIEPGGFVGPVRLMVGIDADGRVLGVRVAEHSETPGIGDAIEADKSTWLGVFAGRSLDDPPQALWTVTVDGGHFDAIAGATVSSRAVVVGVRRAVQYFTTHRDQILAP